jgi:hypothetical protein
MKVAPCKRSTGLFPGLNQKKFRRRKLTELCQARYVESQCDRLTRSVTLRNRTPVVRRLTVMNHVEEPGPAIAGQDAEDRPSSVRWVRDTLTDSGLGALRECIRAAHDAAGGHAADLSSVLGRINELFRKFGDPGAGYWQVRARSAEASSVVFEVLLGRLPGGAGTSLVVPLSSEAGSGDGPAVSAIGPQRSFGRWGGREETAETGPQTAEGYQGTSPSGIRERVRPDRARITDDGRVVLIRCHAAPQPEHAADGDMTTLTSLCRWLRAATSPLRHRGAGRREGAGGCRGPARTMP